MKIFLSHSSLDKKFVRKIYDALISQGYEPWLDEIDIPLGGSIPFEISKGLDESDVVLAFISKNSVSSNWVNTEWQLKFFEQVNKGKVLVLPLLMDNCDIPILLKDKRYADFRNQDSYETGLAFLLNSLQKIDFEISKKYGHESLEIDSIRDHTKELLDELEEEVIIMPTLSSISIVDTLKHIPRSGKLVRLENYQPQLKVRSIYDHVLSVAHLADCLLPIVNYGITLDKHTELARIIAFHELNEVILGDIPTYTNLKDKNRETSKNKAERCLRSVAPDKRERIANEFIWLFLSEKQRQSMESVLNHLAQPNSNLTSFFKMLDKIDPIVSIWRYLYFYRDKIGDPREFLKKVKDFFEYPDVRAYITSQQFGPQVSELISILQNRVYALNYYLNPNYFVNQQNLFGLRAEIITLIIEGCPLYFEGNDLN
jgi:5'-deoxynucleotidase YfbR-like HD superfamily hydrolase